MEFMSRRLSQKGLRGNDEGVGFYLQDYVVLEAPFPPVDEPAWLLSPRRFFLAVLATI